MLNKLSKSDLGKKSGAVTPLEPIKRGATIDENEGDLTFDLREEGITDIETEILFPVKALTMIGWYKTGKEKTKAVEKVKAACTHLRLWPVKNYSLVKNREVLTYEATDSFPVFLIDEEKFKVFYFPAHPDPDARYWFYKDKPKRYLHGLAQIKSEMAKRLEDLKGEPDEPDNVEADESEQPKKKEKKKLQKIKEVIIVSEPAEAFGLALYAQHLVEKDIPLNRFICWISGKEPKLEGWDFAELAKSSDKVYQVRCNTTADKMRAHELALEYLDLYTIELPEKVKTVMEQKELQLPVTNLQDYFNLETNFKFNELLADALPYRFWEKEPEYMGRGDNRVRVGWKYDFDNVQAYNFLNKMGFFRLQVEGRKTDYIYVQQEGNIISERTPNKVKNYIHRFLEDRRLDKDLRNTLYKSPQLNESSLSNIRETVIDFKDNDEHRQYMFFQNGSLEVTAENIKLHPQGAIDRYVWENNVIKHDFIQAQSPFTITQLGDKGYDIKVNHHNCLFFNYLIQTSRIHWRRELEVELMKKPEPEREAYLRDHKFEIDSDLLTEEERYEQKQHLINKIFALGHVLHRHKSRSKTWAVVGTDDKISHDGKSHGGSGKSLCFNQGLSHIFHNIHSIPGTNPSITQNPHIFHGLDKNKQALIVDDADKYLNFRFFFEFITSDQVVNNKNGDIFKIAFEDLCKLIWLTNYSFSTDPSTERRILYTVFSDYYHQKSEANDYKETREPKDDFGKDLFTQFDAMEFNGFYNTMANCLQFYLWCPIKFMPPMSSVNKRKLQREMGVEFESWAAIFFDPISENTDKYFVKEEAYAEFMKTMPRNFVFTSNRFKTACESYCKFHGYVLNPEELLNTKEGNRIVHMVQERKMDRDGNWNETGVKRSKELFYIQTRFDIPLNTALPGTKKLDDLPF